MALLPGLTLMSEERNSRRYRALVRLEPGSPLLAGHFPGHPILPGIAHLGMGVCAIDAMQGRQHHLVEVHGARFRQPVVPGDLIELTVVSAGDAGSMQFELRRADTIVSRGLLVLEG